MDCFKCSSRNRSNPACEDPFHNLNTTRVNTPILPDPQPSVIYHTPCYAGRKNRDGLFPASACIKLTGVFGKSLTRSHWQSGGLAQQLPAPSDNPLGATAHTVEPLRAREQSRLRARLTHRQILPALEACFAGPSRAGGRGACRVRPHPGGCKLKF